MKFIWEDNYVLHIKLGHQLMGIQHNNKRPIKVIITIEEICEAIKDETSKYLLLEYLHKVNFVVANVNDSNIQFIL